MHKKAPFTLIHVRIVWIKHSSRLKVAYIKRFVNGRLLALREPCDVLCRPICHISARELTPLGLLTRRVNSPLPPPSIRDHRSLIPQLSLGIRVGCRVDVTILAVKGILLYDVFELEIVLDLL